MSSAPPSDELEVIALLADHPSLIATAEADKAFWLLTDERLRAMYSAARAGESFHEHVPHLPTTSAERVLSGTYADHKDPRAELLSKVQNLEARRAEVERNRIRRSLAEAQRTGNHDKARLLSQLGIAERKGDHELAARLRESLAEPGVEDSGNRKQVD